MRIYMQTRPEGDRAPRFLQLVVQEDLLSGWTLIRESGAQGSPGKIKRTHYADVDAAMEALMSERERQTRRGYQVVYVEGDISHDD